MNLRRVRKAAGVSQQELALSSGVSIATVKNIERGENLNPELETLQDLARACRVEVSSLTGAVGKDEMAQIVDAFAKSDQGLAANPTDEEKAWLRSLGGISWLDGEPSHDSLMFMLLGLRKRRSPPA